MNQDYEEAVKAGIERYRYGMAYGRELFHKYAAGGDGVLVLLASEDEEINRDTLRFLRAYRKKYRSDHFIIVSCREGMEKAAETYAKAPHIFVRCGPEESQALERLYNLCRLEGHMIVNSFRFSGDHDAFLLADGEEVTKADITARVVLRLDGVPGEEDPEEDGGRPAGVRACIPWYEGREEAPYVSGDIREPEERVRQALSPLVRGGRISEKDRIALFGVTGTARMAQERLKGYRLEAYLDNDPGKRDRTVSGIPVRAPEQIQNRNGENADLKILICSRRYREIIAQLMSLGYERGRQIFVVYPELPGSDFSETHKQEVMRNR